VVPAIIAAFVSLISTIASVVGVILGNRATKQNYQHQKEKDENDFKRRQTEDERGSIRSQLNDFYGPLQQHLGKSKQLYEQFVFEKPENFRTLVELLNGHHFLGNDEELLAEILRVTQKIDELILTHGGLVNDDTLQRLLSEATAHFTYMRLAHDKKIRGDVARFEKMVYPRDLNEMVDEKVRQLQNRLHELNERSVLTEKHPTNRKVY
jgi:hypothetical protein